MVIVEATAVSATGRGTVYDMGLWRDDQVEPLRRVADAIKSGGAVPAIQLNHSSRKGSLSQPWEGARYIPPEKGGWNLVGPSRVAAPDLPNPVELTLDDIAKIVECYRNAAERALAAGFQALEIHAAHGFLLHSFLSPLSNHRTDQYGGSLVNRMRLTEEVIGTIRSVWPSELPLILRISATDWMESEEHAPQSWTVADSAALAIRSKTLGVDLIDVSSGGIAHANIPQHRTYQTDLAGQLRRQTGVAVGAVGRITTARQASDLVDNREADVVLIGRALLRNASWANESALQLGAEPRYLKGYAHFLNRQALEASV